MIMGLTGRFKDVDAVIVSITDGKSRTTKVITAFWVKRKTMQKKRNTPIPQRHQ